MPRDQALQGNGAKSLAGTSEVLAVANLSRREIIICNNSVANAMFLAYDEVPTGPAQPIVKPAAAAGTGVRLAKEQTLVETEYKGEIRIIGTAADIVSWVEV